MTSTGEPTEQALVKKSLDAIPVYVEFYFREPRALSSQAD